MRRQRFIPLGLLSAETPNPIYTKLFLGFGMSGFCDVQRRGVSHLGFLGAETLNPIYTKLFLGFCMSGFCDVRR
jgi:hypothetical protein